MEERFAERMPAGRRRMAPGGRDRGKEAIVIRQAGGMETRNGCERLEAALAALDPDERGMMELFLQGLGVGQIARQMGRDEATVAGELRRLVGRLRRRLGR